MFRISAMLFLMIICGCNSRNPTEGSDDDTSSFTATVVSYDVNAEWSHYDDGSFATYDHLTLELDSDDKPLIVVVSPNKLPGDSLFRIPGTRFTFTSSDPIDPEMHYSWGAIKNPTILK